MWHPHTVTSHDHLGRVVARFVIIFIGAGGLIGKWGQSNEAARLSGYRLYIPNQAHSLSFSENRQTWIHIIRPTVQAKIKNKQKLSSRKLKARWTEFQSGFTCQHISDIYFLFMPSPSVFPSFLPSNRASHTVILHAPIILSEDETSTFEHIKIKRFLVDSITRLQNPRTPANRSHAMAAYLFLQITATTATTVRPPAHTHAHSTHAHT